MKNIVILLFLIVTISCKSQNIVSVEKLQSVSFIEQLKNEEIQLIDVRTSKEYEQGAIKDARLMNFFDEDFKEQLLKLNKEKPVYVYCKSGGRSKKTSKTLVKLGFKEVYDVKGGYDEWKKLKN